METVRELCEFTSKVLLYKPICVETGCMYTCGPGNEVHTTTNNISSIICSSKNGHLYSFDVDEAHVEFAKSFCGQSAPVTFFVGDSVDNLKKFIEHRPTIYIDLLCLDSKEFDEQHMVNEYTAVCDNLSKKHYIWVDDIHNNNSVKYKKMVPMLKDLGYQYVEVPTPTGLFVASRGLPLPQIA